MRHQYGISAVESQTFLLAKRPSPAMSEEKRLPFAGQSIDKLSVNSKKTKRGQGQLPVIGGWGHTTEVDPSYCGVRAPSIG